MEGCKRLLIMLLLALAVAASCLCISASAESLPPSAATSESTTEVCGHGHREVRLSTAAQSLNAESYRAAIASIRAALGVRGHSITLPCQEPPPSSDVLVTLSDGVGRSVTLRMEAAGASLTAYRAGDYFCVFNGHGAAETLPAATCYFAPGIIGHDVVIMKSGDVVGWGGDRGHPAAAGDRRRRRRRLAEDVEDEGVRWGARELDRSVSSLHRFAHGVATKQELADGITACVMMIENAARFQYIERRMSIAIRYNDGVPDKDPSLRSLARSWLDLSAAILEAHQGLLSAPVILRRRSNDVLRVDNLNRGIPMIAMLYCHCLRHRDDDETKPRAPSSSASSVVVQGSGDAPARRPCEVVEATSRLVGPDGKCVDVRDGSYADGAVVELWPCMPDAGVSQLWTFWRDGTIRSNGKCLTRSGSTATGGGDHAVVIRSCPASPTDAVVWDVWDDGTVVSGHRSSSGRRVLSATSTASGSALAVRPDDHSTGQAFSPTNDTEPLVAAIVGYDDLCLEADGGEVWIAECCGGKPEQVWAYYPDGSVRPGQRREACLAFGAKKSRRELVRVIPCDPSSFRQRWVFQNEGSFLNWRTKLVMEVRGSDPSLREIVVHNATGRSSQNWALVL